MPTIDIEQRIEEWRKQLLDTSKRNRLISCKIGRTGAIALEHPSPSQIWRTIVVEDGSLKFVWKSDLIGEEDEAVPVESEDVEPRGEVPDTTKPTRDSWNAKDLEQCFQSPNLDPLDILTPGTDKALAGKLTRLSLAAKTSLSEQGVNNVFLAFGILRWFESVDSDVELLSPLILIPAKLSRRSADSPWELSSLEEELIPNHSLLQLLKTNFDLELPTFDEDKLQSEGPAIAEYLEQVRQAIADHGRWEVREQAILGAFGFQRIAMWKDLGDNKAKVAGHDLCRGIAGDRIKQRIQRSIESLLRRSAVKLDEEGRHRLG
jgi:hypothetical protein